MWHRIKFTSAVAIGGAVGLVIGVYEWWSQWVEGGRDE